MLSFWDERMPVLMDLQLGTLDREGLEAWGEPERHLHWGRGIGWVKGLVREGDGGGEREGEGNEKPVWHEGVDFNVVMAKEEVLYR